MRNPLNTLFGRMALLTTVVLLAIQSAWFVTLAIRELRHEADGFGRGILLALQSTNRQGMNFPALPSDLPMRARPFGDPAPEGRFHPPPSGLSEPLGPPGPPAPPGLADMHDGNAMDPPPPPPGPPIRTVPGNEVPRTANLHEPTEAQLVRTVRFLKLDLKAPITHLKLRANLLADDQDRAGLLHDIDSLSNIVEQFLDFAGRSVDEGSLIEADAFLGTQFAVAEDGDGSLFELDLRAGPAFQLPRVLLDRLVTNLVENALEYGAPPVRIATARQADGWVLTVRDHGAGIPEDRVAAAMKPFVRLDAARGGEARGSG